MSLAIWTAIGFAGQALFAGRLLVQWIASERSGRSVIPDAFWHLSLLGGITLLIYAVHQQDPVFFAGQAFGLAVYARNLWLRVRPAPPNSLESEA